MEISTSLNTNSSSDNKVNVKTNRTIFIIIIYLSLTMIAILLQNIMVFNNYITQFWFITSIITTYNCIELANVYQNNKKLYFLQPVVLGTFVLFFIQFGGITNYLMRSDDGQFAFIYNNKLANEPKWLAYTMGLVLLANVAYWVGYKLSTGRFLVTMYFTIYKKYLNFRVSRFKILLGWLIGCAIKLIINYYGAIGHKYILLIVSNKQVPGFVMRLKVFENLSFLFLIMMLYVYYQNRKDKWLLIFIVMGFTFEFVFAVTSGSRFTIIALFIGVFMVDYYFRMKIKFYWILLFCGVFYFAMTVIKGYKDYIFSNRSRSLELVNPLQSVEQAIKFNQIKHLDSGTKRQLKETARIGIVSRLNYINDLAQMVRYKNVTGLQATDPDFTTPFITFPVYAVFPRFYLFGVSEPGYGYWATKKLGGGKRTSTAISPIGFSYLGGGIGLVLIIFLILGVLMKACGILVFRDKNVVGFVVMIALISTLANFDSVVSGSFINLIRYGLLLPPLMWLLLKKYN